MRLTLVMFLLGHVGIIVVLVDPLPQSFLIEVSNLSATHHYTSTSNSKALQQRQTYNAVQLMIDREDTEVARPVPQLQTLKIVHCLGLGGEHTQVYALKELAPGRV